MIKDCFLRKDVQRCLYSNELSLQKLFEEKIWKGHRGIVHLYTQTFYKFVLRSVTCKWQELAVASSCYLIKREKSEENKKTWIASRSCKLQQNSVEIISNICGTSGTGSPWALFSSMCMIKIELFKGFSWELSIIQVTDDAKSWQFFLFFVNI